MFFVTRVSGEPWVRRRRKQARRAAIEHILAALALVSSSCSTEPGSDTAAATRCVAGDPSAPLELEVLHRGSDGELADTEEMSRVPLFPAIQGGMMLLVGVRVRNLRGCTVQLGAALVDSETEAVVSLERRPVTLIEGQDGWLTPARPEALSNFSSLPACPRANLTRQLNDEKYELRVSVEDESGKTAERSLLVVPACEDQSSMNTCRCLCAANYVLGQKCEPFEVAAAGSGGDDQQ
jgi:hypothetical protein